MILDKWQEEALNHKGHLLLCTGRQVGKTTIMARKAAERMISQPGCKIIIVSLTEDQAKLIIVMILDYLEKNAKQQIAKGKNKPTQNRVILKNKSSAIARPVGNTGDAVRGFTGNVLIIDEASRMPDLVWTASRPTLLTTAGEIWMCSTPYGKQGYFWDAFQNKDNRFKVIHISSVQVMEERELSEEWTKEKRQASLEFLKGEKAEMTELQFGQEYLGLFLDDLRQFFPDELIDKCCTETRRDDIEHNHPVPHTYYLGVDIARLGDDETTYEIVQRHRDGHFIHVQNIIKTKQRTTQTEADIILLNVYFNFKKIYLDAGAGTLGVSILDHLLQIPATRRKVTALNNRAIALDKYGRKTQRLMKEDLYDNLKALMERGQIRLLNDESVRLSLKSVQEEYVGNERGIARRFIHGKYTHVVEGLIRAAYASKEKLLNSTITYI